MSQTSLDSMMTVAGEAALGGWVALIVKLVLKLAET